MDNRIFDVNGKGQEMLGVALGLAFVQWSVNARAEAWSVRKEHGLILYWALPEGSGGQHSDIQGYMTPLSAELVTPLVWQWLQKVKPGDFKLGKWEGDADHDGSNMVGWRVYVEDWGHVGTSFYTLCAVKPVWLWYGK